MALAPNDLTLTQKEHEEANKFERWLDEKLRKNYVQGLGEIKLMFDDGEGAPSSRRVANEIVRRYRAAGWEQVETNETTVRPADNYKF